MNSERMRESERRGQRETEEGKREREQSEERHLERLEEERETARTGKARTKGRARNGTWKDLRNSDMFLRKERRSQSRSAL